MFSLRVREGGPAATAMDHNDPLMHRDRQLNRYLVKRRMRGIIFALVVWIVTGMAAPALNLPMLVPTVVAVICIVLLATLFYEFLQPLGGLVYISTKLDFTTREKCLSADEMRAEMVKLAGELRAIKRDHIDDWIGLQKAATKLETAAVDEGLSAEQLRTAMSEARADIQETEQKAIDRDVPSGSG
jgi:hypothetical protein